MSFSRVSESVDRRFLQDFLHAGNSFQDLQQAGVAQAVHAITQSGFFNFPGLGLLGSQTAADPPEKKAGRYDTIEQVRREGLSAVLGMADKLTADPRHAPTLRQIIQRQQPAGVMAALQAMAERPDSLSTLSALTVPVVIVHGLEDNLVPVERAREMKAALPAARLTELPGVGHCPPVEAPEETAAALKMLL